VTLPALITRLYARLGPRYLGFATTTMLVVAVFVGIAGVAALGLYIDMSAGKLALLVATVEVFWAADVLVALRLRRDRLQPVARWLEGERDDRSTTEAWRAAATLPFELGRHRTFYLVVAVLAPAWDVFAVWLLDLPVLALPVLVAGNVLIYAYWVVLRFLAVERVLRPVLLDVAEALPANAVLPATTVPLRTRLLASMPPLLVITGAVAPGLAAHVHGDVARLATGIGAAVVVAFTLGGGVIELLADSIVGPVRQLRRDASATATSARACRWRRPTRAASSRAASTGWSRGSRSASGCARPSAPTSIRRWPSTSSSTAPTSAASRSRSP
jgi:hypothetical protein